MYLPKHFQVTDRTEIDAFIRANAFATLVSVIDGAPFATHLPLVYDAPEGEHGTLRGHVARANPHWQAFEGERETLAIFHGPHAYVSPHWYENLPAVPTWNYSAVHVYGAAKLMSDQELSSFVDRLTGVYEGAVNPASPYEVPGETKDGLIRGIVGFVMPISRIEAKFKLSQNRSAADQDGVIANLTDSERDSDQTLGNFMQEHRPRSDVTT